jgi:hypothetical protein
MNIQTKPVDLKSTVSHRPLSKMIGEMAVIASVQTSSLGMTRLDKQASAQSDRNHGAMLGAGKTSVKRLPGSELAVNAIKGKQTEARALIASYTTQWGRDRRLLPNVYIGEVSGLFHDIKTEHDKLRDAFVAESHAYIQRARDNLGSYDVTPPSMFEIERAFALNFELAPVPDISAYTTGDSALERSMKERFEADIKAAYEGAQKDLLKRLAEPLENMVERMKAYDAREARKEKEEDVGKTGTFKSTIVTNITDIAKIFRAFNVTDDPFLEQIANELDQFEHIEHKELTKSEALRADVAKKAASIRAMLGDL